MIKDILRKIRAWDPYVVLAVVFSVILTNNTLFFGTNANGLMVNLVLVLTGLAAVGVAGRILLRQARVRLLPAVLMAVLCVLLVLSALVNGDLRMGYVYKVALVVLAWGIGEHVGFGRFARAYDKVMTVLAIASLVGFGLYFVWPAGLDLLPAVENTAGLRFHHLFVFAVPAEFAAGPRNYGIFREPGVFQMYLILAMVFQLTVLPKTKVWKLLLYAVVILTTMSTIGFLALALVLLLALIQKGRIPRKTKQIIGGGMAVCGLAVLLMPGVAQRLMNMIFGKLNIHGASGASSVSRYASVVVNLQVFLREPFLGVGITALSQLFPVLSEQVFGYISYDNTNMVLMQFAQHGLLYGAVWAYGFVRGPWKWGKTAAERIVLVLVLMLLMMCQNYNYSLIATLLLFYCFAGDEKDGKVYAACVDNPIACRLTK